MHTVGTGWLRGRRLRALEWNPRERPELVPTRFVPPHSGQGDRPDIHRVQDANTATLPNAAAAALARAAAMAAAARLAEAMVRAALAIEAASMAGAAGAAGAMAMAQAMAALSEAMRAFSDAMDQEAASYPYVGNYQRILEKNEIAEAARLGFVPTDDAPIDAQGRQVFVNPQTGEYIVRAENVRTPGVWERLDEFGDWLGFADRDLQQIYPDPPPNPGFTWAQPAPQVMESTKKGKSATPQPMSPDDRAKLAKQQKAKQIAAQTPNTSRAISMGTTGAGSLSRWKAASWFGPAHGTPI